MSRNLRNFNSKDRQRQVFRRDRTRRSVPIWRQFIQSLLMLAAGIGLLAFLNWVPQHLDGVLLVSEAIADLIRGMTQLLRAFLGLGTVILMGALVLLGLTLLLGGFWRMLKLLTLFLRKPKKTPRSLVKSSVRR